MGTTHSLQTILDSLSTLTRPISSSSTGLCTEKATHLALKNLDYTWSFLWIFTLQFQQCPCSILNSSLCLCNIAIISACLAKCMVSQIELHLPELVSFLVSDNFVCYFCQHMGATTADGYCFSFHEKQINISSGVDIKTANKSTQ